MIQKIIVSVIIMSQLVWANNVLQEAIDKAKPGSRLELPAGIYRGNIVINKPLVIDGKDQKAIIEGDGKGTVVTILSSGVTVKNLTIRHSGAEHERVDAGIVLKKVEQCSVENCKIIDCLFGMTII